MTREERRSASVRASTVHLPKDEAGQSVVRGREMVRWKRIVAYVGIGLFGGFAFLAFQNDRAAKRAEHDHPPIGAFVAADGVRLHYVRKGSGPVVVLIHGNPGSVEDWTLAVLPDLAETHHVIAFDRPGHGY